MTYPEYEIETFGSFRSGLATFMSDLDVSITNRRLHPLDSIESPPPITKTQSAESKSKEETPNVASAAAESQDKVDTVPAGGGDSAKKDVADGEDDDNDVEVLTWELDFGTFGAKTLEEVNRQLDNSNFNESISDVDDEDTEGTAADGRRQKKLSIASVDLVEDLDVPLQIGTNQANQGKVINAVASSIHQQKKSNGIDIVAGNNHFTKGSQGLESFSEEEDEEDADDDDNNNGNNGNNGNDNSSDDDSFVIVDYHSHSRSTNKVASSGEIPKGIQISQLQIIYKLIKVFNKKNRISKQIQINLIRDFIVSLSLIIYSSQINFQKKKQTNQQTNNYSVLLPLLLLLLLLRIFTGFILGKRTRTSLSSTGSNYLSKTHKWHHFRYQLF